MNIYVHLLQPQLVTNVLPDATAYFTIEMLTARKEGKKKIHMHPWSTDY
jgi:hypothetical protein